MGKTGTDREGEFFRVCIDGSSVYDSYLRGYLHSLNDMKLLLRVGSFLGFRSGIDVFITVNFGVECGRDEAR